MDEGRRISACSCDWDTGGKGLHAIYRKEIPVNISCRIGWCVYFTFLNDANAFLKYLCNARTRVHGPDQDDSVEPLLLARGVFRSENRRDDAAHAVTYHDDIFCDALGIEKRENVSGDGSGAVSMTSIGG